MTRRAIGAGAAMLAMLAAAPGLDAHAGHDERIRILENGGKLRLEFSLHEDDLMRFDADGDGHLRKAEFAARTGAITQWIDGCLAARGDETRVPAGFADLPVEDYWRMTASDPVPALRVVRDYKRPEGTVFRLDFGCFIHKGESRKVEILSASRGLRSVTLTAEKSRLRF